MPDTAVGHNSQPCGVSHNYLSCGVRHPVGSLTPEISSDLTAPPFPDNASSAVARMAFGAAQGGAESRPRKMFFPHPTAGEKARTPPVPAAWQTSFNASRVGRGPWRLGAGPGRAGRPDGTVKPRRLRLPAATPQEQLHTIRKKHSGPV